MNDEDEMKLIDTLIILSSLLGLASPDRFGGIICHHLLGLASPVRFDGIIRHHQLGLAG